MKKKFTVAIVGRPNVGKSALFNRVIAKRRSIVEDVVGVTRDRIYETADVFGKEVQFIDTGGISFLEKIPFREEIIRQTLRGVKEADAIIFVVDGTTSVTNEDEEIASILLKSKKPVYLAINKIDNEARKEDLTAFYALGCKDMFPLSAIHGNGVAEVLEAATSTWHEKDQEEEPEVPKIAILGRPNAGKSTLMNFLLKEERCVVSPIAGTTRDSVDVRFENFILIDTAGIRKKKSEKETVDKFAAIRTQEVIERSDICLVMCDAREGVTACEKSFLQSIIQSGKGCILFLNKWDLVKDVRMEHVIQDLKNRNSFLQHFPIIVGSADTGRNVEALFPVFKEVWENLQGRISTGALNTFLERKMQENHPPMIEGRRLRIYYLTQYKVRPPSFALFVNEASLLPESYRRYLMNQFRKTYPLSGCPLHFKIKQKKKRETV